MSEPRTHAEEIDRLAPELVHWTVYDDRIGYRSDAYAILLDGGAVMIDPLPLAERALGEIGPVSAICLTGAFHQRSAWRYREHFGAKVYVPVGGQALEGTPDVWYGPGDPLPGGLRSVHCPGPTDPHHALFHEATGRLFTADLLMREDRELFVFMPDFCQDDPRRSRVSARRLLDLPVEAILPAHGLAQLAEGRPAILEALRHDDENTPRG